MKRKYLSADQALQAVAQHNSTTVDEVKKEITIAILAGMSNPDPAVQARWKAIPHAGDVPAPKEMITYISKRVISSDHQQATSVIY